MCCNIDLIIFKRRHGTQTCNKQDKLTSQPIWTACLKEVAPTGPIMNSCMAKRLPAWEPPLITFIQLPSQGTMRLRQREPGKKEERQRERESHAASTWLNQNAVRNYSEENPVEQYLCFACQDVGCWKQDSQGQNICMEISKSVGDRHSAQSYADIQRPN
jgi:hypothetical protein